MWQDIAVCVIGISVIGYIAYKVYRMFAAPKSKDRNPVILAVGVVGVR